VRLGEAGEGKQVEVWFGMLRHGGCD